MTYVCPGFPCPAPPPPTAAPTPLPPLLLPKGSLARSNASEGYPFEKVKSPRELAVCYAVDSFIAPCYIFFFFFSFFSFPTCISHLGHSLREEGGRRRDLKNVPEYHILLSPLKRSCSRALMPSLMEHLSLEVL